MTSTDRIDGVVAGLAIKAPVRAATTANITLKATQTIDGVSLSVDDRVLVKDQTDASENGIYVVKSSSWQRALDFNGNRDVTHGTSVRVNAGTLNAGRVYVVTNSGDITIGTTELNFAFSSPPAQLKLATVADMTALKKASLADGDVALARGRTSAYDDGGGLFAWDADATDSTDSGLTFAADEGGDGRWKRLGDGPLNVKWFGAAYDGSTDDTTAVQAAFDAADATGRGILFPAGSVVTGKIDWKGQNVYGAGSALTTVIGKDSEDILFAVRDGQQVDRTAVRGVTFRVNDDTDASGSFSRGGVGNAAMAFEWQDGTDSNKWRFDGGVVDDVRFTSKSSTAQNKSCGIYNQTGFFGTLFQAVEFFRLDYGYYGDYPSANVTSSEVAGDENAFVKTSFNGCGVAVREVNTARCTWINERIVSCTNGHTMVGVTSSNRSSPRQNTYIDQFIESATTSWTLVGNGHVFLNPTIQPTSGVGVTIDCDYSDFINAIISQTIGQTVEVSGDYNRLDVRTRNPISDLSDTGIGNAIRIVASVNTVSPSQPLLFSKNKQGARERSSAFVMRGLVDDPYVSDAELLIAPDDMYTSGGSAGDTSKQAAADEFFGRELVQAGGGALTLPSLYFDGSQGEIEIGRDIPAAYVRIYVRGKAPDGATTQFWKAWVDTGGGFSELVSTSLSWGTTYSVQSYDVDLSSYAAGDKFQFTANNLAAGTTVNVAWIAVRPVDKDSLTEVAKLKEGTSSPSTESGFASLFVNETALVKYGSGVERPIAHTAVEVTVSQADLASGAAKTLVAAITGGRFKIRDIKLSGAGTNFSGGSGDRDIAIQDESGNVIWSVIPAATAQSLAFARWGDTGLPAPATASHLTAEGTAGEAIVATYSGGTNDYTAGSLTLLIEYERTT